MEAYQMQLIDFGMLPFSSKCRCTWHVPNAVCMGHKLDAVVFCGMQTSSSKTLKQGALRLLAYDGAPSSNGKGRLDMFLDGHWAPICSDGFSAGAANIACKQMGYSAVASPVHSKCLLAEKLNFCGVIPPHVSELSCGGEELDIMSCSFENGLDVFCAPNEAVVLSCAGVGDAQGHPEMIAPGI